MRPTVVVGLAAVCTLVVTATGVGRTSVVHKRIAFVRGLVTAPDGVLTGADIYVVGAGGSALLNLTADDPAEDLAPAWAPGGRRLAFVRVERAGQNPAYAIWVMNADGSSRRPLTTRFGASPDVCRFEACGALVSPTWSPDGKRIAFARWTRAGRLHLWTMRAADGRQQRQLTRGSLNDADPTWSPDGRSISFFRTDSALRRPASIWVVRVRTLLARQLLRLRGSCGVLCPQLSQTSWAPTARSLAFAEPFTETTGGVSQLNVTTKRAQRLTPGLEPTWSSVGTSIAYAAPASTDGRFAIHLLDVHSRTSTALTDPVYPFDDEYPAWQP